MGDCPRFQEAPHKDRPARLRCLALGPSPAEPLGCLQKPFGLRDLGPSLIDGYAIHVVVVAFVPSFLRSDEGAMKSRRDSTGLSKTLTESSNDGRVGGERQSLAPNPEARLDPPSHCDTFPANVAQQRTSPPGEASIIHEHASDDFIESQ